LGAGNLEAGRTVVLPESYRRPIVIGELNLRRFDADVDLLGLCNAQLARSFPVAARLARRCFEARRIKPEIAIYFIVGPRFGPLLNGLYDVGGCVFCPRLAV